MNWHYKKKSMTCTIHCIKWCDIIRIYTGNSTHTHSCVNKLINYCTLKKKKSVFCLKKYSNKWKRLLRVTAIRKRDTIVCSYTTQKKKQLPKKVQNTSCCPKIFYVIYVAHCRAPGPSQRPTSKSPLQERNEHGSKYTYSEEHARKPQKLAKKGGQTCS